MLQTIRAIVLFTCFLIPTMLQAQDLRVGSILYPPFGQDNNEGICPEIWEAIALNANLNYTYVAPRNISQTLQAVSQNNLDIAIGPLSITSDRLETVAFTLPFYQSEIGILIPAESETFWSQIRPFLSWAVLTSIGALLLVLFIVGNLMWAIERKENPSQFPPDYLSGIGNGMWFSLVTLTTVGYGDRAPVTTGGRIVAGAWMVISMVIVSSLIAGLASAFTVSLSGQGTQEITTVDDLRSRRIAVVTGTTSAQHAANYEARLTQTDNLPDAVSLLKAGKVEGVAFGKALLSYHLKNNPELQFKIADLSLATEDYGFAVPINSPHLHAINVALKKLEEEGRIETIINTNLH